MLHQQRRHRADGTIADAGGADMLEHARHHAARLVLIAEGADRVAVAVVEEDAGHSLEVAPEFIKLRRSFGAEEGASALVDGVPDIAAVLGDTAGKRISLAIGLHLGGRTRGVERDRMAVLVQQSERLDSGRRGRGKSEQPAVDHAVDIERDQRRLPARRDGRPLAAAITRRLHGEEIPGAKELSMESLLALARGRFAEQLFVRPFHRPEAGEQFVEHETMFNAVIAGRIDIAPDQACSLRRPTVRAAGSCPPNRRRDRSRSIPLCQGRGARNRL